MSFCWFGENLITLQALNFIMFYGEAEEKIPAERVCQSFTIVGPGICFRWFVLLLKYDVSIFEVVTI